MLLTAVDGDYVDDAQTATNLRAILHRAPSFKLQASDSAPAPASSEVARGGGKHLNKCLYTRAAHETPKS